MLTIITMFGEMLRMSRWRVSKYDKIILSIMEGCFLFSDVQMSWLLLNNASHAINLNTYTIKEITSLLCMVIDSLQAWV